MKGMIAVGALCLGLGYVFGALGDETGKAGDFVATEGKSVFWDGGRSSGRSRERFDSLEKRDQSRMSEIRQFAVIGDPDLVEPRFTHWVYSLELDAFPEVFDFLMELKGDGLEGLGYESAVRSQIEHALIRWYELDPDAAFLWLRSKPEALGDSDDDDDGLDQYEGGALNYLGYCVLSDGYHRDPAASFERSLEYMQILRSKEGSSYRGDIFHLIGRWSDNLFQELVEVQKAENGGPIKGDEELKELIKGLVSAGREGEVMALKERLGGGLLDAIEGLEVQALVRKSDGWKMLMSRIDQGEVSITPYQEKEVFRRWAEEDRDAAITWYLKRSEDDATRSKRITKLAAPGGPFEKAYQPGDPWIGGRIDYDGVNQFLEGMAAEGESVEEGYAALSKWTITWRDLDRIPDYFEKLGEEGREQVYQKLRPELLDTRRITIEEGEVVFSSIDQSSQGVIRKLGVEERLGREVAERNDASLDVLHRWLGVE